MSGSHWSTGPEWSGKADDRGRTITAEILPEISENCQTEGTTQRWQVCEARPAIKKGKDNDDSVTEIIQVPIICNHSKSLHSKISNLGINGNAP